MIEKQITDRIIDIHKSKKPIVVAICGAADLGKSHISKGIVSLLNENNISSAHLSLDSYLLNRNVRKKKGLSGYQIESHDIESIQIDIENWLDNGEIKYRPYCHKLGVKDKKYKRINSTDVLLIEGLFSMNNLLLPYIDFSIFIFTSSEQLKNIRSSADIIKRGYSKQYSEMISNIEFDLYQKNIEPFKNLADCKLKLLDKWNYIILEKEN